ncbi:MAG: PQQ-binding-like beta-propeller repeat protein, partial [Deltaproteobacteria bacterium]|nr:PQQ-binding-like beta-propeller repeat protein [Deltaproteobacteria bacterium]
MRRAVLRITLAGISTLLLASGCTYGAVTGAFDPRFPDNRPRAIARIVARLPAGRVADAPSNARGVPLALVTTHETPRAIAAYTLADGANLWTHPLDAMTRPEILGDVVMSSTRDALVALGLADGHELWRAELSSLAYVGSCRSGADLVYATSVGAGGGSTRAGRVRAVDARTGLEHWAFEVSGVLGRPACAGGFVFIPWDRQNIAILDATTGLERARLRTTDDVLSWVRSTPAGVFYGSRGAYRFNAQSASGTKTESSYHAPFLTDAPREPLLFDDAFFPTPGTRSARGRIRLYASPAPSTDPAAWPLEGDTVYFVYYRYVFATDLEGHLRWARSLAQDVVNAQVLRTGLLTAGERGDMRLLDTATGADRFTLDLGTEFDSVAIDARGLPAADVTEEAPDLRSALVGIAGDPDNRLVPARAWVIQRLAALPEPEITRDLLDLYAQRAMPAALREAIATALRGRSAGAEFLVQALRQHYDFLDGTTPPPLALIVPSLIEAGRHDAVIGLVDQLNDPSTPFEVLPQVVHGIVVLGDASVVPALASFLRLYRADSTFAEHPEALTAAADGIFHLGGVEGRGALQAMADAHTTTPGLSQAIHGLFEAETHQAEAHAQAEALAAQQAAADAARREVEERPMRLSQEQINAVFVEHADDLRACMQQELANTPRLSQVRIVFIMNSDGTPRDLLFAPNGAELVSCLQPVVQGLRFPPFRARRQRAVYLARARELGGAQA